MAEKIADRFFLYGYYGQDNLGDDLLMLSVIAGIRELCPSAGFTVRSGGPIGSLDKVDGSVELANIDSILSDQSKGKIRRGFETLLEYRRYFRRCTWFIFGGGTLFHERKSAAPLMLLTLVCLLARVMGLRIAALGVGVAELKTSLGRLALRAIISMSQLFAVRDGLAYSECEKIGSGQQVMLTGDLVFSLASQLQPFARIEKSQRELSTCHVGLSINPWLLHDAPDLQRELNVLAKAVSTFAERGWIVSLLSFHNTESNASDQNVLNLIRENIQADSRRLVRECVLSADMNALGDIFSGIDIHCGMRFHGHVLAAIYQKPFVGISADNKIDAICGLFEMPLLALGAFGPEDLVDAVDQALRMKINPEVLEMSVCNAQRNFTALNGLLNPAYERADARQV